jgi:probable rRNA maturation factor
MISIENNTDFIPPMDDFLKILEALHVKDEVELSFVNSEQITQINKQSRNIDKSTDVLSFPIEPFPHAPIGAIVINVDAVIKESTTHNHSQDAEACLLFLHGLLHLLGFDHENDSGQMREKEAAIVKELGLPPSLIVRTNSD